MDKFIIMQIKIVYINISLNNQIYFNSGMIVIFN